MLKHKYLEELLDPDEITLYPTEEDGDRFNEDISKYGFASKETWCIPYAFFCWVYERFSMFKEVNNIALSEEKLTIDDKEYTADRVLDSIIELSKYLVVHYDEYASWTKTEQAHAQYRADRLFDILKQTLGYWWW